MDRSIDRQMDEWTYILKSIFRSKSVIMRHKVLRRTQFILLRRSQESGLLFTVVRIFRLGLPSDTWLYFRPLLCPATAISRGLSSVPALGNFLTKTLYQPWKVHVPSGTPPSPFWLSSTLARTPPNRAFDHAASLIPAKNSTHCLIHASGTQLLFDYTTAMIRLVFSLCCDLRSCDTVLSGSPVPTALHDCMSWLSMCVETLDFKF